MAIELHKQKRDFRAEYALSLLENHLIARFNEIDLEYSDRQPSYDEIKGWLNNLIEETIDHALKIETAKMGAAGNTELAIAATTIKADRDSFHQRALDRLMELYQQSLQPSQTR